MTLSSLTMIFLVVVLIAVWWQHTGFFHHARALAKARCAQEGVQLLDDSVAFDRFAIGKTTHGWRLQRVYEFEFTSSGSNRYTGRLWLIGEALYQAEFEPYSVADESVTH